MTGIAPAGVYLPVHRRTLILEVSESDPLADTQVWRNVSPYLKARAGALEGAIAYDIGVDPDTGDYQPATLSLWLDNSTRAFDTRNTESPFRECLQARRQIRLREHAGKPSMVTGAYYTKYFTKEYFGVGRYVDDAAPVTLFHGFVNEWPRFYGMVNQFSWVNIQATDGSMILNGSSLDDLTMTLDDDELGTLEGPAFLGADLEGDDEKEVEQRSDLYAAMVLDAAEWPTTLRDLDPGYVVVGISDTTEPCTDSLLAANDAEFGALLFDNDGRVRFHDRLWPWMNQRSAEAQAVFGGPDGLTTYDIQGVGQDRRMIASAWRRVGKSGTEQIAVDDDARKRWGRATDGPKSLIARDDDDVARIVDVLKVRHGSPVETIEALVVEATVDPATLYDEVIHRRVFDRIDVNLKPPGGDAYEPFPAHVRHISVSITSARWQATYRLTPAPPELLFTIDDDDDPAASVLDGDDVLGP